MVYLAISQTQTDVDLLTARLSLLHDATQIKKQYLFNHVVSPMIFDLNMKSGFCLQTSDFYLPRLQMQLFLLARVSFNYLETSIFPSAC